MTAIDRLVQWLSEHPNELMDVAMRLRLPLPVCEGAEGPCTNLVVGTTLCRTAYADWEKNKDPLLCPYCAVVYNEIWDEQWREYNSGRL